MIRDTYGRGGGLVSDATTEILQAASGSFRARYVFRARDRLRLYLVPGIRLRTRYHEAFSTAS